LDGSAQRSVDFGLEPSGLMLPMKPLMSAAPPTIMEATSTGPMGLVRMLRRRAVAEILGSANPATAWIAAAWVEHLASQFADVISCHGDGLGLPGDAADGVAEIKGRGRV